SGCGLMTNTEEIKFPLILDMVHHNPGETPYQSAYNNPETIKEMGYNGKVYFLFESPMLAINWESVDSDILPKDSEDRKWVDQKAEQIRSMQAASTAAGLTTLAQSDLILFPKRLVEKYDLAECMGDARDPEVERLVRAQIAEMFDQFPLLDGLVTRIGETYLHDAPYHLGAINDKSSPEKTIIPLLNILRDEICVKRNKLLIFRTWVSFDTHLDRYMKVSDSVEPHKNLVIAVKHCEGDFHRSNPFSKVIGEGRHPQIIEIQCAREYEGKGAYPHYVANGVIEGFEEHQNMPEGAINSIREFATTKPELYAGIWTWTRGGGWGGPYIKDELWCDLNAWVVAQWAADPTQREEDIFNRYAVERMKLKGDDVAKFRRLCLLSADAVIRGKNSVQSDLFRWWTRDAGLNWPSFNKSGNPERAVAQKEESLVMWNEIIAIAKDIEWADDHTRRHVIGSCYYGLHLYEIYRAVVTMRYAVDNEEWTRVDELIKDYDTAWAKYNALPAEYPEIATLYQKDYKRHIKNPADDMVEKLRKR
ncbi:MAG: hypothetical protein SNI57_04040, partial [Rikenellaceae bacterium]